MDYKTSTATYIPGTPYVGATVNMYAGPGHYRGEFAAWDITKRQKVWAIHEKFPVWSGTMVTAGSGLQFSMLYRIATAWLLTLPITILIAGGLYYLLAALSF